MAADLAAPDLDVETRIPFDPDCGALDGRRFVYELIELLDLILLRDDGLAECTVFNCSFKFSKIISQFQVLPTKSYNKERGGTFYITLFRKWYYTKKDHFAFIIES